MKSALTTVTLTFDDDRTETVRVGTLFHVNAVEEQFGSLNGVAQSVALGYMVYVDLGGTPGVEGYREWSRHVTDMDIVGSPRKAGATSRNGSRTSPSPPVSRSARSSTKTPRSSTPSRKPTSGSRGVTSRNS